MEHAADQEPTPSPLQGLWLQAIHQLEQDLLTRDSSERTRRAYTSDLAQFAAWSIEQD